MITLISLMKRNPKISQAEFREQYENLHSKMVASTMKDLLVDYQRNYPTDEFDYSVGQELEIRNSQSTSPKYDVITKMTFASRANFEKMLAMIENPQVTSGVEDARTAILDRDSMQMFVCEQEVSDLKNA